MTEQEMMQDLAAADAAGDHDLAAHIAGQIKAARTPQHGTAATVAHYAAKALPLVGGMAGGILGAGAGGGLGSIATGAAGAGLLSAAGRAGQHAVDQWLGYEKPMSNADAIADTVSTGAKDAAMTGVAGMGMQVAARALPGAAAMARNGARAIEQRILTNKTNPFSKAKPISPEALDEAADRGAFKFFGTSAGTAKRLQVLRETQGAEYGQIIKQLEANGITGPEADSVARKFIASKSASSATTMNPSVPRIYESAANRIRTASGTTADLPFPAPASAGSNGDAPLRELVSEAPVTGYPQSNIPHDPRIRDIMPSGTRPMTPAATQEAPDAKNLRTALDSWGQDEIPHTAAPPQPQPPAPGAWPRGANVQAGDDSALRRFISETPSAPQKTLGLTQTENLKRSAQGMARSAYKRMQPGEVGEAHKNVASILRQSTEAAIDAQAQNASPAVQDLASQFVPVKKSLGNIIEASDLADEGMRAAGKRHFFSLPDKAAMIAEFTHSHNPVRAALTGAATHLLQTRGPSSAATILRGSAGLADALTHAPQAIPVGASVAGPVAAEQLPSSLDALLAAIRRKQTPLPQLAQAQ